MMRTIAAILALAPVAALAAKSTAPAQPRSTPVLQSALLQPLALAAAASADTTVRTIRVSTGVTTPVRLTAANPVLDGAPYKLLTGDTTLVIAMTVDPSGRPTNLKLVRSAEDKLVDNHVLAAVSQFRYRPGTIDGRPVAYPLTVEYTLQQGARF